MPLCKSHVPTGQLQWSCGRDDWPRGMDTAQVWTQGKVGGVGGDGDLAHSVEFSNFLIFHFFFFFFSFFKILFLFFQEELIMYSCILFSV